MTYPKIYPVACPDRTCKAPVGEPCTSHDGLMHTARAQMYVEHLHRRAAEARSYVPTLRPGNVPRSDSTHCTCAERRKP